MSDKDLKQEKKEKKNAKRQQQLKRLEKELEQTKREAKSLSNDIKLSKNSNKNSKQTGSGKKDDPMQKNVNGNKKPSRTSIIIIVIAIVAVVIFLGSQMFGSAQSALTDELTTSEFIQAVEEERVSNVEFNAGEYSVKGNYRPKESSGSIAAEGYNNANNALNSGMDGLAAEKGEEALPHVNNSDVSGTTSQTERAYHSTFVGQDSLLELMQKHPNIQYTITLPSGWTDILISLLPVICVALLIVFFFSQMSKMNNQQMGFGKTKARKAAEERPDVTFKDVAGVDEAVEEMSEVKDFLSNPKKYQEMGAKIPRGCLLVGPPGTGKTLLARAVAGEAGVPFFNISGSDFVEMFVGVGASRVRDLFRQAKEAAPSIIFIDEIDAVGRHRGAGLGGGHDEREQTLNQMLVEMDGFDQNDSVVLIAATNRADILDPALLRPGRFDRQIIVDVPDVKGREKILKVHSKNKPLEDSVDLWRVAQLTPGFTGADLANLMNESALLSARKNKKTISQNEITESMERVIAGPERKSRIMDDETKNIIAFHESGHALVGFTLPKADPVHKISIVSRGRALGYTLSIPKEDKVLNSYREMMDELAVFMGGRVAEEIFCDDITTGASNDLERATKMARSIVTQYGMSAELGTQVFGQPNHEVFLGKDYGNTQDYSEQTAQRIDKEVARIMREAHDTAYHILATNQDQMKLMASVLLERETVEGDACDALLNGNWDEYLAKEEAENKERKEKENKAGEKKPGEQESSENAADQQSGDKNSGEQESSENAAEQQSGDENSGEQESSENAAEQQSGDENSAGQSAESKKQDERNAVADAKEHTDQNVNIEPAPKHIDKQSATRARQSANKTVSYNNTAFESVSEHADVGTNHDSNSASTENNSSSADDDGSGDDN